MERKVNGEGRASATEVGKGEGSGDREWQEGK